jgi:hypothetical protein
MTRSCDLKRQQAGDLVMARKLEVESLAKFKRLQIP